MVATARKLTAIEWRILTSGEPYRYALPRTTTDQLARLRGVANGEKRRGSRAKGQKCEAKLAGGSRSIRSLDQVYANEGLPTRSPSEQLKVPVDIESGEKSFEIFLKELSGSSPKCNQGAADVGADSIR